MRKDNVLLDLGNRSYTSRQPINEYVSHAIITELRRNGITTLDTDDSTRAQADLTGEIVEYAAVQRAGFWDVATISTCTISLSFSCTQENQTLYERTYSGRYQFSDWIVSWQDEDIRNLVGNCTHQMIQQISSDRKLVQALFSACP